MRLEHYIVDAFVCGPFTGNPAAVTPLEYWLDDDIMQAIAAENNLSETAFFVRTAHDAYDLRWFTPTVEIDLCGHATLASAHVLIAELDSAPDEQLSFATRSGELRVALEADLYAMTLPAITPRPLGGNERLLSALGAGEAEVFSASGAGDVIVVFDGEATVRSIDPDLRALAAVSGPGVCVTAPADEFDYVTRLFAPNVGIDEDPATGSAQCGLAPYWGLRLGKSELSCFQASARGAELGARWAAGDDHVTVLGRCRTFVRGQIELPS
ncbi:MAG: PhzF family phenazine biosynthesis protein [Solirubrobacterales bacterium]